MSRNFILIDSLNVFFRAIHTVSPSNGVDVMAGMSIHTILNSIGKVYREQGGGHVVFCQEGKSWRKSVYPKYKLNRAVAKLSMSDRERETQEILLEAFNDLSDFMVNETNVTAIHSPRAEADDMIAGWVRNHPDDNHTIISTDTDFIQLLKHDNVRIYNGVNGYTYHKSGITDERGSNMEFTIKSDGKIKVGKANPNFVAEERWYDFAMFLKYVRGDKSDNVFSAFPGARLKGTKNKVGITEAYVDRSSKGFHWNNFMLQRWTDEEGDEQLVKDCFERNQILIDLERLPDDVREEIDESISSSIAKPDIQSVGLRFLKFCGKWDLKRISDRPDEFARILNTKYNYGA